MEVKFQETVCPCLNTVLREIQNQEQTQEMKLTDGMPDIGRVLAAWGQTVLRSKEWQEDRVSLSGGMRIWVLYAPEDGTQSRCIDGWVPFQMHWELPMQTPEGKLRIACLTRFVDARSVSARKIMVRCGIGAYVEAHTPMEAAVYLPETVPEGVELLRRTYPVRLPRESGERTFLVDEELNLPASVPEAEKLLYYTVSPQVTEEKVMGNKILFRGNLNLHVLYISEEGQLYSWDFEVPVSQFAALEQSHSGDAQVDVMLSPTNVELDLNDEGQLRLKAGLVAQYLVDDTQMLELISDAYSPGQELTVHSEMLELPVILETRQENVFGEQTIPAEANIGADVQMLPDFPRQQRREDRINMEIPGTFQVLYYGEDGSLQSANTRWQGSVSLPADENSRVTGVLSPAPAQITLGSGMTARSEIPLRLTTTGTQGLPMVTGLEMGEARKPDPNRPSLILQRAGDLSLWEIAKRNGSTMAAIRKANGFEAEPAPGQMLLIPVS